MGTRLKSNRFTDEEYNKLWKFYKSDKWHSARNKVIARANERCEMCGKVDEEVHHKIYLTPTNVDNLAISTNPDNPIYLCKECHNKIYITFLAKVEMVSINLKSKYHSPASYFIQSILTILFGIHRFVKN